MKEKLKPTIRERMIKMDGLRDLSDLPWDIRRAVPELDISSAGISFSDEGDILTLEEFRNVLKYLLKQVK
jgi:hypothetical protein